LRFIVTKLSVGGQMIVENLTPAKQLYFYI